MIADRKKQKLTRKRRRKHVATINRILDEREAVRARNARALPNPFERLR